MKYRVREWLLACACGSGGAGWEVIASGAVCEDRHGVRDESPRHRALSECAIFKDKVREGKRREEMRRGERPWWGCSA